MWIYEKKLQYPVKIKNPNPGLAKLILTQLGGPDGELGASMRYLNQRYVMPNREVAGILTDVGTEYTNCIKKSATPKDNGSFYFCDYCCAGFLLVIALITNRVATVSTIPRGRQIQMF